MPGRFRTASRPSRTVMSWAPYEPLLFEPFFFRAASPNRSFHCAAAGRWDRCIPRKAPTPETPVGRVGALHKTALDTSRLAPEPDGSASYKMPANRDKMATSSDGSGPNRRRTATWSPIECPRAVSRRVRRSGPRRSSSCAQTPDSQATVTTPSRSETGAAAAASRSPATSFQAAWTWARRVAGAMSGRTLSRAFERGRGPGRLTWGPPLPPRRDELRALRGLVRRGLVGLGVYSAHKAAEPPWPPGITPPPPGFDPSMRRSPR